MMILGKNIVKKSYSDYPNMKKRKNDDYYWGKIKLPRKLCAFLWDK